MGRKLNPKQTIENILSVSGQLFVEKGFEKTSMQDIVNASGMSKGAIFHHFKSKEDIFKMVVHRQSEYAEQTVYKWIDELKGLTAKEKLMSVLEKNLNDQQIHALDNALALQIQSPHFVLANMQSAVNKSAPVFAKIMREGIADGSITTAFPEECAEVFFLLINIWCDHMIFECDMARLTQRMKFLQQIMKQMGADIISDELISKHMLFMEKLYGGSGG
jgi:TetR/AcrR family acrAB operon transcriptional repressor